MCLEGTVFLTALNLASCLSLELEHPHNFAKTVFIGLLCVSAGISSVCLVVMSGG